MASFGTPCPDCILIDGSTCCGLVRGVCAGDCTTKRYTHDAEVRRVMRQDAQWRTRQNLGAVRTADPDSAK